MCVVCTHAHNIAHFCICEGQKENLSSPDVQQKREPRVPPGTVGSRFLPPHNREWTAQRCEHRASRRAFRDCQEKPAAQCLLRLSTRRLRDTATNRMPVSEYLSAHALEQAVNLFSSDKFILLAFGLCITNCKTKWDLNHLFYCELALQ